VLSGGELGAAVIIDAVARLQDGALNDAESAAQDSFEGDLGLLDCPHSQPAQHPLGDVPDVLRSGNHAAIAAWRRQQSLVRTASGARTCWMNRRWARPTASCWSRAVRPETEGQPLAQGWLIGYHGQFPSAPAGARSTQNKRAAQSGDCMSLRCRYDTPTRTRIGVTHEQAEQVHRRGIRIRPDHP
jgi:hypothetical protein